MLPDAVFKEGEIASGPLEFAMPERYLATYIHNGPLLGPRIRLALLQVGLGDVDASGFATEIVFRDTSFRLDIWQDTVYGFNIVQFDGWPEGYLVRRLNQIGFVLTDTGHFNYESGWAAKGDDFQIVIDLLDYRFVAFDSSLVSAFEWKLYSPAGAVEIEKSYPEDIWTINNRWLTYVLQEETQTLSGECTHEAIVTLTTGETLTVFTGTLFFYPTRL